MTQPSYTTDLATVSLADAIGTWAEIPSRKSGGAAILEDRAYIQGSYSISQSTGAATGKTVGLQFDYGSNISWTSGDVFLFWQYWQAPAVIDTWSNGGMRVGIGSGSGDIDLYNAQGNDTRRNPYGGWDNIAIDPEYASGYDERVGTPTAGNYRYFWSAPNMLQAVSKGNPHCVDAIRYGRAELIIEYGDATNGYCTFEELGRYNDANDISFTADTTNTDATLTNIAAAEVELLYPGAPLSGTGIPASTYVKYIASSTSVEMTNNATATGTGITITSQPVNRLGLFKKEGSGYLWKGLMTIGTASNAVDFRDENRNITIDDTPRTYAAFNKIEVRNVSSNVEWIGINITALNESGLSIGQFEMIDNSPLSWINCVFTGMSTFAFDSNATILTNTFRRCAQINPKGGDLSFSIIAESAVTGGGSTSGGALLWNDSGDPNTKLNDMTFTKGAGSHHAIEFGTSAPTTINLTNMTFTDFSVSNQQTTSVLYFPDTGSDVTWTVQHTGTTGTISYYKARGGDTVNISSSVTMNVTIKNNSGYAIEGVRVRIENESTGALISNGSTNSSGLYTDNYTGSTPLNVKVIARLKGYNWYPIFAQITGAGGLEVSFTLSRDNSVNLP